jgi:hypothetical protein
MAKAEVTWPAAPPPATATRRRLERPSTVVGCLSRAATPAIIMLSPSCPLNNTAIARRSWCWATWAGVRGC